ncbi:MAG TPA: prepilin-type N-terminal cleavage/methylation domain-containing protein [Thermoleophilaceae bacterium]|jgi:type IV pilus assembly protein PilA
MRSEEGFSLLELLVVVLILGALAAIALPAFLGAKGNAHDGDAKSRARNLAREVETCFVDRGDYRQCDAQTDLADGASYSWGTGPGQVRVTGSAAARFTVESYSKQANESNKRQYHRFRWVRAANGSVSRLCDRAGPGNDSGGCSAGTW